MLLRSVFRVEGGRLPGARDCSDILKGVLRFPTVRHLQQRHISATATATEQNRCCCQQHQQAHARKDSGSDEPPSCGPWGMDGPLRRPSQGLDGSSASHSCESGDEASTKPRFLGLANHPRSRASVEHCGARLASVAGPLGVAFWNCPGGAAYLAATCTVSVAMWRCAASFDAFPVVYGF